MIGCCVRRWLRSLLSAAAADDDYDDDGDCVVVLCHRVMACNAFECVRLLMARIVHNGFRLRLYW